jgi:hypothetical protein
MVQESGWFIDDLGGFGPGAGAGPFILRVYEKTGALLFDLNNPDGTGNPQSLRTRVRSLDGGGNTKATEWFSPSNRDGDSLVFSRHGRRVLGVTLTVQGSAGDFATLRAGVEELISVLEDGSDKEIWFEPDGATGRFLDFHTADISRILSGGDGYFLMQRGMIVDYPLSIYVGPWERGAETTFINALTFGVDPVASVQGRTFTMTGNTKAPLDLIISPVQAGSKVSEIIVASRTRADVADLVSTTGMAKCDASANTWTVALENDTTAVDDTANGGVGSGARLLGTSTNVGVMLRRVRITRTTLLDSLRGWEREFLRMRASAVSEWEVQLRWSPSLADPAGKTNTAVRQSIATGTTVFQYSELDLGHIMIPEEGALGGVALEIWARRISGTGDLHMNFVRNLPATPDKDVLTRIVVPGGGTEQWLGSDLTTPPYKLTADPTWIAGTYEIPTPALNLNATNEAGGVPPNTGQTWNVGRHVVTFALRENAGLSPSTVYKWRIVQVGSAGSGSEAAVGTHTVSTEGNVFVTRQLTLDVATAQPYQPQVNVTTYGNAVILVNSITHEFIPVLSQNEQAHTEPDNGIVHKRDSSGSLLGVLGTEGQVPLMAPPELTAIFIIPLDVPKAGYTESESVKARTVTATAEGPPRFLG